MTNKKHSSIPSPFYSRGVGMIEVMVTFVIISVGILAVIGMQVTAKQANYDAVQRTTASHLATDIIERMRANPTELSAYLTGGRIGGGSLSAPSSSCASGSACSASQMAAEDLYQWERLLDGQSETRTIGGSTVQTGGIVSPRACITGPVGGGTGLYEVTLVWRGTQEQATGNMGAAVCNGALDGTGLYGDAATPTSDGFRRVVRVNFFIVV